MAAVYAKSTLGMGALPLVLCKLTILPRNIHSSVNDFVKDDLRASKIDWHGENDWVEDKGGDRFTIVFPLCGIKGVYRPENRS